MRDREVVIEVFQFLASLWDPIYTLVSLLLGVLVPTVIAILVAQHGRDGAMVALMTQLQASDDAARKAEIRSAGSLMVALAGRQATVFASLSGQDDVVRVKAGIAEAQSFLEAAMKLWALMTEQERDTVGRWFIRCSNALIRLYSEAPQKINTEDLAGIATWAADVSEVAGMFMLDRDLNAVAERIKKAGPRTSPPK